jgi:RecG-like helicase
MRADVTDEPEDPDERSRAQRGGALRRALRRFVAPAAQLDAEALQDEVSVAGATPVARCHDREIVRIMGTLRTVTLQPRAGTPALEAELWDGSGSVELVWLGRRRISGIEPGRAVLVEGRVSNQDGRKVMFNPRYELRSTS